MPSSSILKYSKGSNLQLSTHFKIREMDCPCEDCGTTLVDKLLISQLEAFRTILGSKLTITSGYRCPEYQAQLKLRGYETAKGISSHTKGMAADITNGVTPGHELADIAKRVGFTNIGVGKGFLHVDTRPGGPRLWTYSKREGIL